MTTTLVTLYSITKIDFLLHLPPDTRQAVSDAVKQFEVPMIPQLWEINPKQFSNVDYKAKKAWIKYRRAVLANQKNPDLVQMFQ